MFPNQMLSENSFRTEGYVRLVLPSFVLGSQSFPQSSVRLILLKQGNQRRLQNLYTAGQPLSCILK